MCKIDIVAEKDKEMCFVEVRYRRDAVHDSGWEYITPRKIEQMQFITENWVRDTSGWPVTD